MAFTVLNIIFVIFDVSQSGYSLKSLWKFLWKTSLSYFIFNCRIIALWYCVEQCKLAVSIHIIPSLFHPPPNSPPNPSRSSQSTSRAPQAIEQLPQLPTSYLFYICWCKYCQCCSLNSSHPLLPPGFPGSSVGKEASCKAGDPDLIPELGQSTGKGIGCPLQYSWASLVVQTV